MTVGPWMDDAEEVEQAAITNYGTPSSPILATESWGWGSTDSTGSDTALNRITRAWSLTGVEPVVSPIDGPRGNMQTSYVETSEDFDGSALWQVMWLTVPRPDPADLSPVESSTVPSFDPDAVGVEWEPATTPVGQRIQITASIDTTTLGDFAGHPFEVKVVDGLSGRYEPGIETAATMSARTEVGPITGTTTAAAQLEVTDPAFLTLGGTDSFAVALLDYWSANQTLAGFPAAGHAALFYHPLIQLYYRYRPRYRFIYSDTPVSAAPVASRVTPSLRMLQRGGSGGIAGIPRLIGDPTVRGSVRRGPGSVY